MKPKEGKMSMLVIFSSHLSEEENMKFIDHIKKTSGVETNVICYENHNEFSLTQLYNKGWNSRTNEDVVVFCHNDIVFKTPSWGKILLNLFRNSKYDIIGLAGSTSIINGCWWTNRKDMYGSVYHSDGLRTWKSIYGKCLPFKEVKIIDGLFMAINPNSNLEKFNESYNGFHFYDLSFCVENYLNGADIAVTDRIEVIHASIGITNNSWEMNKKQFINQYGINI